MKSVFNICLVFLVLVSSATGIFAAGQKEFTRAIKKEFDISPTGTTAISNKYGKVDVKTWTRNRVKIDVTIVVNASSEEAAQKVFNRINISFSNSSDRVKAETVIEPRKKSWWDWSTEKTDYSINYEVYLPPSNNLDLTHKYGDVFVAQMEGKVNLNLKYGNFKMESAGDDSRIYLAYGKGSLGSGADLFSEVSYSSLAINEINDLEMISKHSNFAIEKATDISCNTRYDNYRLGTIRDLKNTGQYDNIEIRSADNVEVNSRYTQVKVGTVRKTLDLDLNYGGAATGVAKGFSEISLVGSYSDFTLDMEPDAVFQMDASANYAGIRYPRAMTVTYEVEKGANHEVKGQRGSGGGVVKARLSYGGLKVNQQ